MCWTKPVGVLMCLVWLLGSAFVQEASAQWYVGGDSIAWYGRPNGKRVGDCMGNCGAGCSSAVNPCGGPRQYWELDILEQHVRNEGYYDDCVNEGDSLPRLYHVWWWEYDGLAEWRYWGHVTTGCWDHDIQCGAWYDPNCAFFFGCGRYMGRGPYKYQEWIWGVREYREAYDWGSYGQC